MARQFRARLTLGADKPLDERAICVAINEWIGGTKSRQYASGWWIYIAARVTGVLNHDAGLPPSYPVVIIEGQAPGGPQSELPDWLSGGLKELYQHLLDRFGKSGLSEPYVVW